MAEESELRRACGAALGLMRAGGFLSAAGDVDAYIRHLEGERTRMAAWQSEEQAQRQGAEARERGMMLQVSDLKREIERGRAALARSEVRAERAANTAFAHAAVAAVKAAEIKVRGNGG